MSDLVLKLSKRVIKGKKVASLRKQGIIPCIVYGDNKEPIDTQADYLVLARLIKAAGKHSTVSLDIDGKKQLAIIKSIDLDRVSGKLMHVAFQAVTKNEIIETEIPIRLIDMNESPAERSGLVILQAIDSIEIKAKPGDIPAAIEVSAKNLAKEGEKISLGDIKLPEGVKFADAEQDLDLILANVYEPNSIAASNESAGGTVEESKTPSEDVQPEKEPATANQATDKNQQKKSAK
jgi:large subunit ribosomal protein L25